MSVENEKRVRLGDLDLPPSIVQRRPFSIIAPRQGACSRRVAPEAVILGCTEIMLLIRPEKDQVSIFGTTAIHAAAAIEIALAG